MYHHHHCAAIVHNIPWLCEGLSMLLPHQSILCYPVQDIPFQYQ